MGVVVQAVLEDARSTGYVTTCDPHSGDPSVMLINANYVMTKVSTVRYYDSSFFWCSKLQSSKKFNSESKISCNFSDFAIVPRSTHMSRFLVIVRCVVRFPGDFKR